MSPPQLEHVGGRLKGSRLLSGILVPLYYHKAEKVYTLSPRVARQPRGNPVTCLGRALNEAKEKSPMTEGFVGNSRRGAGVQAGIS